MENWKIIFLLEKVETVEPIESVSTLVLDIDKPYSSASTSLASSPKIVKLERQLLACYIHIEMSFVFVVNSTIVLCFRCGTFG